jgi:membrane-associated phospholipid phosphatase
MHYKRAIFATLAAAAVALGAAVPAWATPATGEHPRPAVAAASASPFAPGTGQLVADWNSTLIALQAMPGAQPATVHPTRSFAIMQGAEYDAVVSITHVGSPYLFTVPVHGPADAAAAADQAAHDVLVALYPASAQTTVANAQLAKELAKIPNGPAKTNGVKVGAAAAAELVAIRSTDGSAITPPPFVAGKKPGAYRPTPPAFSPPVYTIWGNVTPFVLESGSQFRPPAPPPVTSAAYVKALRVTESLGQDTSKTRTAYETFSGKFWATQPIWNLWNEVAQNEVVSHDASLAGATAMFATLDFTLADTAISLYDAKYHYLIWRPVTAIQTGIPGIKPNPNWNPLLPTAPDPSYPGAHSGFSFAAATILDAFFGADLPVTVSEAPGMTLKFHNFMAAANDAALSRIWAGQHTPLDDVAGRHLGAQVASFVLGTFHPLRSAQARQAKG